MSVKKLTADVDLQLTEVCILRSAREPHDDVSVRRQVAGTLHGDRRSDSDSTRVLTADCVVPRSRCRNAR